MTFLFIYSSTNCGIDVQRMFVSWQWMLIFVDNMTQWAMLFYYNNVRDRQNACFTKHVLCKYPITFSPVMRLDFLIWIFRGEPAKCNRQRNHVWPMRTVLQATDVYIFILDLSRRQTLQLRIRNLLLIRWQCSAWMPCQMELPVI